MTSDDTTESCGDADDTPPEIARPDADALQQLATRLAALAEADPADASIWAPSADRARVPDADEPTELRREPEIFDGPVSDERWIDEDAAPADDLWDVAQLPPVSSRGPIVPLEIVIPIVVLSLLIVVFVSWTS